MPECPCENFGNGDGSASGEQITVNGVGETEGVSDGTSAEQLKNRDDAQTVEEMAEQEIVFVKKSRMLEKKLCMVRHQVNKSQIGMMMTKVLKPHKWEMVLVKQKRSLMAH